MRLALVLSQLALSGCAPARNIARTFSPGGGPRLYRIEQREDQVVCIPEKPWGVYVEACVRALALLGGGVIEVQR